nr:MAG TPA: Capsid protein [Cressdnaviricota sp.]
MRLRGGGSWYPLAKAKVCKFKYFQEISLNPTAGLCADYVFHATSIYDPDNTGTGHQPYGFDQIMAMYDHFTVLGSKIKVTAVNNTNAPIWMGIKLRDENTNLTGMDLQDFQEQPGTKKKLIGWQTSGSSKGVLTLGCGQAKFLGLTKQALMADTSRRGDTSSNPADGLFFHVMIAPQSVDDLSGQIFAVEIEYTAALTEPHVLGKS